jgi:threonine/homoserine/homoserine lactone efflux protein
LTRIKEKRQQVRHQGSQQAGLRHMTLVEVMLLSFGLLVTPGPTNTLLALASSAHGRKAALALIPAEVGGYLMAVVPLMVFGTVLMQAMPQFTVLVQVVAGLWVGLLAARLWRSAGSGSAAGTVTPLKVFVTTLMNPKALLFGLVLLPSVNDAGRISVMAAFIACIVSVAAIWVFAGGFAQGTAQARVRKAASVVLSGLSVLLLHSGLTAVVQAAT